MGVAHASSLTLPWCTHHLRGTVSMAERAPRPKQDTQRGSTSILTRSSYAKAAFSRLRSPSSAHTTPRLLCGSSTQGGTNVQQQRTGHGVAVPLYRHQPRILLTLNPSTRRHALCASMRATQYGCSSPSGWGAGSRGRPHRASAGCRQFNVPPNLFDC